jgi:hypothetical protein
MALDQARDHDAPPPAQLKGFLSSAFMEKFSNYRVEFTGL